MKVLLTGGTGFLGRRLVAALRPRHPVRLLVRRPEARRGFPDDVEFASGDVVDGDSLERAAAGCETVVHAAALVKILAPGSEFERTNVVGLENVLRAARGAGARRVVYVSSFIALGPTENGPGGTLDENAEPSDRDWINPYERSKTLADRRARSAIAAGEPWNVVYPGVIYGPGELTEGNIVVRHLLDLAQRRVPALLGRPERRWNYVFVDDVARGIVDVLERAPAGGRYVLGGENVTQAEFYRLAAELGSIAVPRRRMPDGVAKAAGTLARGWAQLTGTVPKLTPDLVEIYRHDWAFDSSRARRELGYEARSLREGLTATFAWLRELGQLP